jgi:hypothetical protein
LYPKPNGFDIGNYNDNEKIITKDKNKVLNELKPLQTDISSPTFDTIKVFNEIFSSIIK